MQQNSGWGVEVTLEFRVLLAWVLISVLVLRSNSMNGRCRSSMDFYHLKTPISRLIWMVFGTESFVPWSFKGRKPRYWIIPFFLGWLHLERLGELSDDPLQQGRGVRSRLQMILFFSKYFLSSFIKFSEIYSYINAAWVLFLALRRLKKLNRMLEYQVSVTKWP